MDFMELQFIKMSSKTVVPTKATKYSIELDLYSPESYLIHPKRQVLIPIQIRLGIPLGYYRRIASKSGLAMQHGVHVGAGVVDPDYVGEIKVLLTNDAKHYYEVNQGDPIAQLILEKASIPILKQVKNYLPQVEVKEDVGPTAKIILVNLKIFNLITKRLCKFSNCWDKSKKKEKWIVTIHVECGLVISKFSHDKCLLTLLCINILCIVTNILIFKRLHHLLLKNKCT